MEKANSFYRDTVIYASRVKEFSATDWLVYVAWCGLIFSLFGVTFGFIYFGHVNGVSFPAYVWNIPIGTFIFAAAISFDTIGHRTVYKEELMKGEALIHHITIFAGITSVLALCAAYENPSFFRFPALVLIALSIIYSLFDEAMHWRRYLILQSDRVEMWSHVFILVGHMIMIAAWWHWYDQGYPGVAETLALMP
jgi:hypothetical protein